MKLIINNFSNFKNKFQKLSLFKKIIIITILIGLLWLIKTRIFTSKKNTVQYQTAQAEIGTLIVSVTGSGNVSTANNATISTQASGVVSKLYVKDGDVVKSGDKIADIDLDLEGKQKAFQASSSYQSAKNSLETTKIAMLTTQGDMFMQWDKFYNLAINGKYTNGDGTPNTNNRTLPEFIITNNTWLASEAKYKNQQAVVNQAQTALNSAWLSYQQTSPTIYAPISGTVTGLSLQVGSVIASTSSNSNTTQTSTKIASVKTKAMPTVTVDLSEIDVPKIKMGNKATVTFDALPDKTFTGHVISIDTAGTISSNVTTYSTVIRLDLGSEAILPNMAASAHIITQTKDNVLLVPSTSVKTDSSTSTTTVQIMKDRQPQTVTVEIGLSSNTQTEIVSGLKSGDIIVTSSSQTSNSTQTTTQSPFSPFGGARTGGNTMRINR